MKRSSWTCLIFIGLCIVATKSVLSQEKENGVKTDLDLKNDVDPMAAWAKLAAPGEQHKRLEPLVGEWTTKTTFMGKVSTGTASKAWTLGGRFVHERSQCSENKFEGLGFVGYDNLRKKAVAVWFDSLSTGASYSLGSPDESVGGKVITFESEEAGPSGEKMKSRCVLMIEGPDRHTLQMFHAKPGGTEVKVLETVYTRKKAS